MAAPPRRREVHAALVHSMHSDPERFAALCAQRPRLAGVQLDQLLRRALPCPHAHALLTALAPCAANPMRHMRWLIARGRMRAAAVFAFVCAPGRAVYALRRIIHPNARVRREALSIAGAIALRQRLLRALLARIGVPTELYARLGVATLSQQ